MEDIPGVTARVILVLVTLGCVTGEDLANETAVEQWDALPDEYHLLDEAHQDILDDMDERIHHIKTRIGKLYSQNSALLHRLNKLDEYIKRGTDMETRYVIEIMGYPFDKKAVTPEEFLDQLSVVMNIANFTHAQVRGLRLMAGMKYSDARLVVEFATGKNKKAWLRAYKKKLYEVSWGDPEKVFGSKEKYKTFQHKTVYLQDFLPTLCEMYSLKAVPFAINEYISPYRKKLLSYAKLLAAHYHYRFVWVSEGDIFVRKKDGEPGTYIRSEKDFRVFDWRLENESFLWKTLNECNAKRRELLRKTTKRILSWMKAREDGYTREWRLTDSLLLYKRKFNNQMKFLLNETHQMTPCDVFDVTYKQYVRTLDFTTSQNSQTPVML